MLRLPAVVVLSVVVLALAACGDDDKDDAKSGEAATTSEASAPGGCRQVEDPQPKPEGSQKAPTEPLAAGKRYEVDFKTSCGTFTIALGVKTAPRTAASFVALARGKFFDGTKFHRIVSGFVIQGGDPTGTGSGGPGYSTRDTPPRAAKYVRGVVAMVKTADESPGTAGSQFYVVTGADAGLPPEYALLGKVTKGLDVTKRIDALGDPNSGQ